MPRARAPRPGVLRSCSLSNLADRTVGQLFGTMAADGTTGGAVERLGTVKAIDNNDDRPTGDVLGASGGLSGANDSSGCGAGRPQSPGRGAAPEGAGRGARWVPGAASTPSGISRRDGSVRLAGPASPSLPRRHHGHRGAAGSLEPTGSRAGAAPPGLRRDRPHLRAHSGAMDQPLRKAWTSSPRRGLRPHRRVVHRVFTDAEMYKRASPTPPAPAAS